MVRLSDLLEGRVGQKGQINVSEIYRLAQAVGMQSQKHRDYPPPSPEKIWVRLSDVTGYLQVNDKNKALWLTASQLATKYNKEAQTIRLWFRDGFFIKRGYLIERDPTGHWRVGIPSDHADYPEFLAFSQSLKR